MKRGKKIVYFGAVVLSIAMIAASSSIIAVTDIGIEKNVNLKKIDATPSSDSLEVIGEVEFVKLPPILNGDTQVIATEDDEIEPAIGINPDEEYLLGYTLEEDIMENSFHLTFSIDGGQTWDPGVYYPDIIGVESHPAISYTGIGKRFTGTIQGDPDEGDGAYQYRFLCDDPTDYETYELTHWDWAASYPYKDRRIPDIGGYNLPDKSWWYGVIACVGTRDERVDMPIFNYANYDDESQGWSSYWDEFQGCENAAIDVDLLNGNFYAVFDYLDGDDWDIILITGGCWDTDEDGYLDYFASSSIGDTENTKYPAIGANNDYVIILAQSDESGDQDIVCFYSNDAGETFQKSTVASSGVDEEYPTIVVYGLSATCTFVRQGNLYYTKTNNGGASWDNPTQINDEDGWVINEFRNYDITTDGSVVWADERFDSYDIFFDNVGAPLPPGITTIEGEIEGEVGKDYEYDFSAPDPDSDIAEFIVNWGDGTPDEVITGPFSSGEKAEGSHTYETGGDFVITARAKDITGLVGAEGTLSVTMPRGIILPQTFVQRLLEKFPHAFPLLRNLLGL
jgi:hypothetical protein